MKDGKMMKARKILILAPALLVMITAGCGDHEAVSAPAPDTSKNVADQLDAAKDGASTAISSGGNQRPATLEYQCADEPGCAISPLAARDREEANWLMDNGYPSANELKAFSALSRSQLKRQADDGSLSAMVLYGERAASEGDTKEGIDYITDAINRGSIYGYYGMSSVYQNTPGLKNVVDSGAYLRVAYTLGDSKAANELQLRFPGLTQVEQAAIDARAASLYQTFAKSKQPIPRP
ncbi:hypothetical protein [Stenotrophomonas sp. NA06056]|uniref:hypothetical protein n=1 Tax=Stenotrophomonas sp. NA06056 TaxID=2742129 RepID=UPI0015883823|nr:hypothetical protein [Stenotrophomonas sp. NA06056]QKW58552.1 hypothetical protein HUT07_18805 [Stenotrophomonas sp. NA06056]